MKKEVIIGILSTLIIVIAGCTQVRESTLRQTQQPQDCLLLEDRMTITNEDINYGDNTVFICRNWYSLPNGIVIDGDDLIVNLNGAILEGIGEHDGVRLKGNDVTVENGEIKNYFKGISAESIVAPEGVATISRNTILNALYGIWVVSHNPSLSGTLVEANEILNASNGIYLNSNAITISNNEIAARYSGIWVDGYPEGATRNIVQGNTINMDYYGTGVRVSSADNNIVRFNTIDGAYSGIQLYCTFGNCPDNNDITQNVIRNSDGWGIYIESGSNDNDFVGNTITNSLRADFYCSGALGNMFLNNRCNTIESDDCVPPPNCIRVVKGEQVEI